MLRLITDQAGASRIAMVLAGAVLAYLALAGSWAGAMFDMIDRLASRLPL